MKILYFIDLDMAAFYYIENFHKWTQVTDLGRNPLILYILYKVS